MVSRARPSLAPHVALALALAALPACSSSGGAVVVYAPADLDGGAELALIDLMSDLERLAPESAPIERHPLPAPGCSRGRTAIVVLGHEHAETGERAATDLAEQEYTVEEERCGSGRRVVVRGGSLLAGQWAVYDLLQRLGVRYFHPEQTYYPPALAWPDQPLAVRERPAMSVRAFQVHRRHPVELSAPLDTFGVPMADYQRRWIDWNVKLRQTWVNGWDEAIVGDHAYRRGFPRSAGFRLLNTQQGGTAILDPDDPRPEEEQMAAAIESVMAPRPDRPDPTVFSFSFNPSEFTEADEHDTVSRLTFVTDYVSTNYPGVDIYTVNHGTHGPPTPDYGVRFYDLPEFAPPALGVQVHTLMFYDLERPAPVYGNTDFSYMLAWARREAEVRRIVHYPESSWWLTFDLPVPLFLAPVTLEARQHDLDLLSDLMTGDPRAAAGVVGHYLFTSGQEWGYWLIDHCVARMSWDLAFTHERCLEDFTSIFSSGDEVLAVLREAEARQMVDLRDPEVLRYLVGSDEATEIALSAGIDFHPLPPGPAAVLSWTDEEAAALETRSLAPLRAAAGDYAGWAERVEALLPAQPEEVAPWLREIRDGLAVFSLRAAHAVAIYETALALRAALVAKDFEAIAVAHEGVDLARGITELARQTIRARELDYRYPPELTIAGDEPGTAGAVPNQTIYPYRYLSRTHRLFYWERPDQQLAALFGEGLELVQVNRRILREGTPLEITLLAEEVADLSVDYGDGTVLEALAPHDYGAQGVFDWTLSATLPGGAVHHPDRAAVVAQRVLFAQGSLEVVEPAAASVIEGLLPGFVVGAGTDASPFFVIGTAGPEGVSARGSITRRARTGSTSGPELLVLALPQVGVVHVHEAVVTLLDGGGPDDRRLVIEGELSTDEIVDLLVSVGGFDQDGARRFVANLLGYTEETLPARVPFRVEAAGGDAD